MKTALYLVLQLFLASGGSSRAVAAAKGEAHFSLQLATLESAYRSNTQSSAVLFQLGHLCHQEAIQGNSTAAKLAERYLTELRHVEPTNFFGRALLGSAIVMKARDAFLPTTKLKWVRLGCAELDVAVTNAPADANVRFTRASNNLFLPDVCGRRSLVRQDFEWLTREIQERPARYEDSFRQYVALFHGTALHKWGAAAAARNRWNDGLEINPQSAVAEEIRRAMADAEK